MDSPPKHQEFVITSLFTILLIIGVDEHRLVHLFILLCGSVETFLQAKIRRKSTDVIHSSQTAAPAGGETLLLVGVKGQQDEGEHRDKLTVD